MIRPGGSRMHAPTLAATLIATSATSATAPHVSGGAKAGAIGIGIAVLVLLYIVTALITRHWNPVDLFRGDIEAGLPNIDSSLMVLMGISQGATSARNWSP